MGIYSISGFLTICLVCYLFYCLRRSQSKNSSTISADCFLLCLLLLGITGLFYSPLEGVNYIVIGIIMIWVCAKSHHSGGGGEYMYIRGWIGASVSLIYGILKVLGML